MRAAAALPDAALRPRPPRVRLPLCSRARRAGRRAAPAAEHSSGRLSARRRRRFCPLTCTVAAPGWFLGAQVTRAPQSLVSELLGPFFLGERTDGAAHVGSLWTHTALSLRVFTRRTDVICRTIGKRAAGHAMRSTIACAHRRGRPSVAAGSLPGKVGVTLPRFFFGHVTEWRLVAVEYRTGVGTPLRRGRGDPKKLRILFPFL